MFDNLHIFELSPIDNRKSFYGKAHVIQNGHTVQLQSYDTIVLEWDEDKKTLTRYWDGYSATTMRHINSFMTYIGFPSCGGKRWWDDLTPDKPHKMSEFLNLGV